MKIIPWTGKTVIYVIIPFYRLITPLISIENTVGDR